MCRLQDLRNSAGVVVWPLDDPAVLILFSDHTAEGVRPKVEEPTGPLDLVQPAALLDYATCDAQRQSIPEQCRTKPAVALRPQRRHHLAHFLAKSQGRIPECAKHIGFGKLPRRNLPLDQCLD